MALFIIAKILQKLKFKKNAELVHFIETINILLANSKLKSLLNHLLLSLAKSKGIEEGKRESIKLFFLNTVIIVKFIKIKRRVKNLNYFTNL